MKLILALFFASLAAIHAADERLLSLIVPPGEGDRFEHAEFSCWLPDAGKPVRTVIIHQHGCTNASPEKHPPITGDWHWRALARKHNCALLVPMYHVAGGCDEWNNPDSGSERALMTALADFAKQSGCAELKDAPWVLWGHSGGSSWSAQMIARHPKRVLAASFRGGCHKQFGDPEFRARFGPLAREIPLLFVWGKRETVPTSSHFVSWEPMNTMFRELRLLGGHVCRVIDPRSEHNCDDSRLMSINFFDAVLSGESKPGALASLEKLEMKELSGAYEIDPSLAWMPNQRLAQMWQEFSKTGTFKTESAPLNAPLLEAKRESPEVIRLTWSVDPALDGGLRVVRVYRDGKPLKDLGLKDGAYLATARDSTPEELRVATFIDNAKKPHTYAVSFLDNAGHESPLSAKVKVE
ncbi:alpha/beta hydrolase family protein [Brevifollis gellanilyticus]|uniref:Peptidase S9 prolyl oligopeptidase catalytic domain-containing protein n=1 Tax=Brevifollis gellanilyticus TaxID=748831 RepID=A0A512MA64_9BACT|nr:hypothetical protein [Brevifollis gellanilyticus]GEP43626.1 hypothetical protein BGE01nite_29170 [Brevifollis gellanilyticus]